MNQWQRQIVIGTILGGSSLVKPKKGVNYYLAMAGHDETWLRYKAAELSDWFPRGNLTLDGNTYRCTSSCSEEFSRIHDAMYRNGSRVISQAVLDPLRDIALAVWYLDGGGKTGRDRRNVYLNLTRMSESAEVIKTYFCEMEMYCKVNTSQGRIRLVFSVGGTEELFKTIAHRFPNFMCHRL